MKYLFTESGLRILEALTFTQTLFAFDYDGTLSKIVADPDRATMTEKTNILFAELSELSDTAIISGRQLKDLKKRLIASPKYLVGNHGLEGSGTGAATLNASAATCNRWVEHLTNAQLGPSIEIENKTYSLAIHFRKSRTKNRDRIRIRESISSLAPSPHIIKGKSVVNILPPGAPHKGMAILNIINELKKPRAFYIGDDDTDEDVFSLPDPRIMSVRVGYKKKSSAQFYVRHQSEINRLLSTLIRLHRKK